MRLLGHNRGQAVLACLTLGVGLMATIYDGVPTSDLELHDGGVWVTNLEKRTIGHLSVPSMTLDANVTATSPQFDVLQEANTVTLNDTGSGTLTAVDSAAPALGSAAVIPPGFDVQQGGLSVAISDPVSGAVWALAADEVEGFSEEQEPTLTKAVGARAAVGRDGTIYVVGDSGSLRSVAPGSSGWTTTKLGTFDTLSPGEYELTAVGATPVLLDRAAGEVRTLEETVSVDGAGELVLQPPGDPSETVALASPDSLLLAPLSGGDVEVAPGGATEPGTPAPPVRSGTCTYAAWGGSGHSQRVCDDSSDDKVDDVERLRRTNAPVFRVNRDVVVLNSTDNGDSFLVQDNMQLVANWDDLLGQVEDEKKKKEETEEQDLQYNATRSEQNHPPKANPDSYGVRPGRSTTLPVLDNDTDQDGDVLTASAEGEPRIGTVLPVRGGEALQIVAGPGAVGADTFEYAANDGRGKPGTARVQVEVHPWSVNGAPQPKDRASVVVVAGGAEVKYNLLQDWIDPDGDPVYLESVEGSDDILAQSREDGTVTITDLGRAKPGLHQIDVRVSDGRETTTGTLDIDLRSPDNVVPTANADHVLAVVDEETTVRPLDNDTDANGDELRLAQVPSPGGGAKVLLDAVAGTFSFTASKAGTVYVEYTVSDGPATAKNIVRVDVVDGTASSEPPVADNDLALLPAGQSVLVPVLANDYDPAGGVLVVQSVSAPPEARLQLDIVNHEFVRVRAVGSLRAPVAFTYTISNGAASASAQVTVVSIPDPGSDKAPIVEDDAATVRAGDIVTVPALANDRSPANLELRIAPKLQLLPKDFAGNAFVAGRDVRFKAGDEPGRVRLTYTVFDSADNYTSGTVVVTVVPRDAPNTPPTPRPLVARVLAGGTVTIPVPTDGVDPEGDSVTLLGVSRPAPTKGVVSVVGGSLKYVAPTSSSGTDKFRYLVEDAGGAQASGSVRVGIAPPSATNQLPTAVADVVKVRPGRKLAVPVTANDTDPDGDSPLLIPDSVTPADRTTKTKATTEGAQVLLTTPATSGDLNYYYQVTDAPGGQSVDGVLTVQVRDKAPLRAPVARDDVVTAAETLGQNTASVDVLANDSDPDGVSEDLEVSSGERGVTVAGGKLDIALDKTRRVVLYTVTDIDGLTSRAVVSVPGTADLRPVIDPGAPVVKVVAGKTVEVELSDHVVVRTGRSPSLTFGNTVQAGPGGVAEAVSQRAVSFTADPSFSGPSAITFEVTDGTDADDASGLVATLSIPVEVLPGKVATDDDEPDPEKVRTPPTFTPTGLQVAPGEDAVEADLRAMTTDPDPGDLDKLRFTLGGVEGDTARVKVSLSGSTLRAEATSDTPAGTSLLAAVSVTDGSTDPVTAKVPITVVSSTRPLLQIRAMDINDAEAGVAEVVDVADYVTNPFAAEGEPITVLSADPAGGEATGKVSLSGTNVTITPDQGTDGQMTVRVSVGDATKDPSREVDGLIRVTVQDRPDAPTGLKADAIESNTASLTWVAPSANGSPITGYTARWATGTFDCGQSTSCTVPNLKNAVEYTFTVTATNAIGTSDKSAASNPVKPDQRPDPPSSVSGEFGDASVKLQWTQPTGDFSAVTAYSILMSPGSAAGATQVDGITGTSATVDNLVNGTAYTFQVVAFNEHPEPSDPSPSSSPIIPAGVPFAAAAPTVQKRAADATQPSATVKWVAPNGNGDDNLVYTLASSNGRTWNVTGTSQEVLMDASTTDVTFTVRATNKAGQGAASPASAPQRFFQKPGPVTGLTAVPTGDDDTAKVTFGAAAGNGATPSEITYSYSTPSRTGTLRSGDAVPGFKNGTTVTIQVWATSSVRGEPAKGDPRSATANTFGKPFAPTVSASGNVDNVTLNWNANGSYNGRVITNVEIRTTDGGDQGGQPNTGPILQGNGRNQTKSIQARAYAAEGGWSDWSNVASASTWGLRHYYIKHEGACPGGAGDRRCVWIRLESFAAGGTSIRCSAAGVGVVGWYADIVVDGAGNSGWVNNGPNGRLFDTPGATFSDGMDTGEFDCR
ncbi:Ig-like domain-containing protein [Nocardioides zhouii]|uniref:Fibronectin type III domain-containing protein n=1 Tax=Nocardioides zhouii TaxID=1168729 RepID=A0A4Q2T2A9_9ACTN|nr:Ig-like domain-containing protein [Nocardioides zhouii]RYC11064.1 fibronectin type III domain-containing protein [Nocardioides zhouii]